MMRKASIIAAAVGTTLIGVAATASAQPGVGGWRVIGVKTVDRGGDTDTIRTEGSRRFRQLRLCALNAPISMRDFDVYFANGGHQDVRTRERINAGTCTRAIDLEGKARNIERIRLKYQPIARGMRAPVVRVTAR